MVLQIGSHNSSCCVGGGFRVLTDIFRGIAFIEIELGEFLDVFCIIKCSAHRLGLSSIR
jgi:hypothetical protein